MSFWPCERQQECCVLAATHLPLATPRSAQQCFCSAGGHPGTVAVTVLQSEPVVL